MCPFLNLSPLSLISLPPPTFQVGLNQMYASMLILEEQSLHNATCLLEPYIDMTKNNLAIHTIYEGRNQNSSSQTLKISMSTYQLMKGMSKKSMSSSPKFASFVQQKVGTLPHFIVTLIFCLYPPTFKFRRLSFHENLAQRQYQNQFY